ncbi:MAG: glycosyltransferase family 4 protein [Candidatus Promineofilum sp.]|nr:glycosyltransferase family 4 protein [Promineifilum sp.]MBP9657358.1 glycosyltransferase family 4 protein [Promineifilum sp.]
MKVAFLPVYPNPYQRLLRDGLRPHGVDVEFLAGLPDAEWLHARCSDVDILHFHWLDGLYMARWKTPLQASRFIARVRLARRLGYRLVWTAHNILPHRRAFRPLDVAIRRLMMRDATAVIVHCEAGRRELLKRFPRRSPVAIIPLGNYKGVYPVTMLRETARASFGLDETQFVYLALGNIAAYKGLERLVEAFGHSAKETDVLLIAGRNRDPALVKRLASAAADDPRLRLHAGFVPDDEMQRYLLAADVIVAPFDRVLTSSSVMVGLSYGLPVIAPNLGCLPELLGGEAGLIYQVGDTDGLARALVEIKGRDRQAMGAAAALIAESLDWETIGQQTAAVYEECLRS